MKKISFGFLFLLMMAAAHAQTSASKNTMRNLIRENFAFADTQYRYMMTLTPPDKLPQSYDAKNDKFIARNIGWWCTGFYPGSLLYIYEQTKDETLKQEAERALKLIEPNKFDTGTHDLGFMMFCSFGNAYRLFKDEKYKDVIFRSAQSLATRYRPSIKSIQSWNSNKYFKCPVIIDNMMNLELLYWAGQNGGDPKLKDIAITHANSTLERHFRPDGSSYHVLDYDPATNKLIRKLTWQGTADESAWSRGQSWGFYGFTMMYRFTKDKRYLDQAKKIAGFLFNHPNMPEDLVPYWDFNAPGIPNAYRDASAAAINASALLELAQYVNKKESKYYIDKAVKIIRSLSSEKYRAKPGENGGYILMHSVGNLPANSEINTTLTYADYYFLEALMRYQQWVLNKKKK